MESILIVDDDLNVCTTLKEELTEVGYETDFLLSGSEVNNYLKDNKVDLVLLDLVLPEKDGYEILQDISEKKIDVKVVVLTAYADVKSAIDSARLGASDFISKPYDLDELLITIRKVLQRDE
jgi:two-component system response regulator HydG